MKALFKKRKSNKFNPVIQRQGPRRKKRAFFDVSLLRIFSPKIYFSLAVVILSLGSFGYYLLFSDYFKITNVYIHGANSEITRGVEIYFEDLSEKTRFFILSQNKTIFFPSKSFKSDILSAFPKIKDAHINLEIPNSLSIDLSERSISGIWCPVTAVGGTPKQAVAEKIGEEHNCYFYDEDGVVYQEAPNSSAGTLITFIRDMRVYGAKAGDTVLSMDDLLFIERLTAALSLAYVRPAYISILGSQEIRVGFSSSSGGWEAYFSREESIITQVENLVLVLEREIGQDYPYLLYVDLRLGNKVFYKFIGD